MGGPDRRSPAGWAFKWTLWGMIVCILLCTGCAKEKAQEKSDIEVAIDSFVGDDYTQIDVEYLALGEVQAFTLTGKDIAALKSWFQDADYESVVFAEGDRPDEVEGGAAYQIRGIGGEQDVELTLYRMGGDERILLLDGEWYRVRHEEELPLPAGEGL